MKRTLNVILSSVLVLLCSVDGSVSLQTRAPDTITSWVASAFAISPTAGIGVAPENAKVYSYNMQYTGCGLSL